MKNQAFDTAYESAPQDTFLFQETKAPLPDVATPSADEKRFADKLTWLGERFPKLLAGDALMAAALKQLEGANRFGALIIDPDLTEGDKTDLTEKDAIIGVAALMERISETAVWGFVAPGVFGCFLPEADSKQALKLADQIQDGLKKAALNPAIIGVSAYPMINYKKADVLENAVKARDHAAFFGPGAAVFFDAVSLNISADKYYQANDIHAAVAEYKKALLLDPSEVNVHNSLGVCYGMLKRFDEALAEFDTAIWLDADEFMAVYNKGMIKLMGGKRDKALELFLQADRLAQKNKADAFETAFHVGKLYLEDEKPDQGLAFLEKALRLNSESAAVNACLGQCCLALGKLSEAADAFQKAVKLNPNDAASLSALGDVYLKRDENPEIALVYCRQSVVLKPDEGLFHHRLGLACQRHQQQAEALKAFQKAAELGYDTAEAISALEAQMTAQSEKE